MFDFGPQSGYIYAAYGIFALGLVVLILASLIARSAARRRLAVLEQAEGSR
jgi:heme exporter protein CcmD